MAYPSRMKNHPIIPERGNRPGHSVPVPGWSKPAPGYPNSGPALPKGLDREGARSPPAVDRYYPEWTSKNLEKNSLAESERLAAEKLLEETKDLIKETKFRTKRDAQEVDTRFKQRVGDIDFWKSELESKLAEMKESLDAADSQRIRLEKALAACSEPLGVSEQCLAHRTQRRGIDLCVDNVQKHLEYEIATIQSSQMNLQQNLATVLEEIRQTKKIKYQIEGDLVGKETAIDIDHQTSNLKISGPSKNVTHSTRYAVDKNKKVFTPADWQNFSEANLHVASGQIKRCLELQSHVDGALATVASHLRSQKDFTDRAFRRRVDEIKKAKEDLEKQLSETIVKIGEMEDGIKDLERAIASKQGPLATCQRKIQQRKQRPNIELVADDVDAELYHEAKNLVEDINRLETQLSRAKNCYASLQKTRLELEGQIDVKSNSLYIDEVKCMTIRASIQPHAY